jgi:predicted porin
MNKKLITIAVVAALAPGAAMAETTNVEFYGRIHASLDSVTGNGATAGTDAKNSIAVNDNSSRFGLKGSNDLGNGMKGLLQFEAGLDGNGAGNGAALPGLRDTYIGLTGGFGTFLVGKLPAANQYVYDSNLFADQLGDAANFTGAGMPGRANRALHYVAPKLGDVTVALTYLPASSVDSTTGLTTGGNSYGIKLGYAVDVLKFNAAYLAVEADNTVANGTIKPFSLAASYDLGQGSVSAQLVNLKNEGAVAAATTRNIYNIGGKFNVSSNGAIKAQYSHAGESATAAADGANMFAVGYDHSLSKQMGMYVVYAKTTNDTAGAFSVDNWGHNSQSAGMAAGNDPQGFGIGLTYNF